MRNTNPTRRLVPLYTLAAAIPLVAMTLAPIRLRLPDAGLAHDAGWVVSFSQSIEIDAGGHTVPAGRTWSAGFRVQEAADAAGDIVHAKIAIDSVRAASILHDTRQPIDTRKIPGAVLDVTWQRTEGATALGAAPTVDFGDMLGGAFPLSLLVDNVFPPMPARAVEAGDSWERTWTRRTILGMSGVEQKLTARFTLERVARQAGEDVARIRVTTTDEGVTGFIGVGVRDGIVREAEIVETGSGSVDLRGASYPYTQKTIIRVGPAGAPSSRHGTPEPAT